MGELIEIAGIVTGFSLLITAILGFNIKKFGLKIHKIFAICTIIFALIHFILQKI
jgi:hypothetical protein